MLKRVLVIFSIAALLSSCGFTQKRVGYYPFELQEQDDDCQVRIATGAQVDDLELVEIGSFQLGETPFLTIPSLCTKEDALKAIRRECCNVNADFANIVFENYQTFMQECYHCSVILYKVPDSEIPKLEKAIAESIPKEPAPDPNWAAVILGKLTKTIAIAGAIFGIIRILNLTKV